jgi:hypothetical protein
LAVTYCLCAAATEYWRLLIVCVFSLVIIRCRIFCILV